jgi:hypothetical protein
VFVTYTPEPSGVKVFSIQKYFSGDFQEEVQGKYSAYFHK